MASIIAPMDEEFKARLDRFSWINWSEVAREEANKRRIFEEYLKSRKLSKDDELFCEDKDWHPVDELQMKPEYVERLRQIDKRPSGKAMDIDEFNKWCESL